MNHNNYYDNPTLNSESVFEEHQKAIGDVEYLAIETSPANTLEIPSWTTNASQLRQFGIICIAYLFMLRNAGTLAKLYIGDTDAINFYSSVAAYYTFLARLPIAQELNVDSAWIKISTLARVMPCLQAVTLMDDDWQAVAHYHETHYGWCTATRGEACRRAMDYRSPQGTEEFLCELCIQE
ncbi:hypothetical protein BGZ93_005772 [Podila epicladia]|nr:hypothetical protein BGZ92_006053 [Podila epicladia]KAG0095532.1 hypothetical protein BGZ93_005772 [Podila epicladia]